MIREQALVTDQGRKTVFVVVDKNDQGKPVLNKEGKPIQKAVWSASRERSACCATDTGRSSKGSSRETGWLSAECSGSARAGGQGRAICRTATAGGRREASESRPAPQADPRRERRGRFDSGRARGRREPGGRHSATQPVGRFGRIRKTAPATSIPTPLAPGGDSSTPGTAKAPASRSGSPPAPGSSPTRIAPPTTDRKDASQRAGLPRLTLTASPLFLDLRLRVTGRVFSLLHRPTDLRHGAVDRDHARGGPSRCGRCRSRCIPRSRRRR